METLKEKGFTFMELMVVLLIIAVSIAIAAPNFSGITSKNSMAVTINDIMGLLQYAKVTARTENKPVVVCTLSTDENNCSSSWTNVKKFGAFKYTEGSKKELIRTIKLPDDIEITSLTNRAGDKGAIPFFPDYTAGMRGFTNELAFYNNDGSLANTNIKIQEDLLDNVERATSYVWQIKSKSLSKDSKCNVISISSLGQALIRERDCYK